MLPVAVWCFDSPSRRCGGVHHFRCVLRAQPFLLIDRDNALPRSWIDFFKTPGFHAPEGRFDHAHVGQPLISTEEFYETDTRNDFARGFAIQTAGPLPVVFAKHVLAAKKAWGWGLRREMMDYNHWATFGLLGEILPWADNRVTLSSDTDQFGLRVAHISFNLHHNDKKLIKAAKEKTMEVMRAAGATEVVQESRYAHLVGAARMGDDPAASVVDRFGRTHDIANLFICDGSILPTQGSANPGLTTQALAARTADYLVSQGDRVFTSEERNMAEPSICRELAPPATWGKGVPRFN